MRNARELEGYSSFSDVLCHLGVIRFKLVVNYLHIQLASNQI